MSQARERAELSGKQAARVLGWSESEVSRLLSGKRGGNTLDVAAFLGAVPGHRPGAGPAARAVPGAEHPGLVPAARLPVNALARSALAEEESRKLIATLATELYGMGEDQDDRA